MKIIWSVLRASSLLLMSIYTVYAQDAVENGETNQPIISCLGLENPQSEGQMDKFRECIKRSNEERKSIRKLELIQKKLEASKVLVDRNNPNEIRKLFVKKIEFRVNETKFRDSEKLMKDIKNRPLIPVSHQLSTTE